ncbi:MAG: hypothetical protein JO171_19705 [Paludibacterium sp.]|uniref:hypothetical protein n=1 Tax=Paludibacterium sp. TaxID=1917523 RepID=UPI0025FC0C47|nr:hypothetical protein [Paludibacterium sp.]MBV8049378.1 hypothetical protein [Paludibacterium sp.]
MNKTTRRILPLLASTLLAGCQTTNYAEQASAAQAAGDYRQAAALWVKDGESSSPGASLSYLLAEQLYRDKLDDPAQAAVYAGKAYYLSPWSPGAARKAYLQALRQQNQSDAEARVQRFDGLYGKYFGRAPVPFPTAHNLLAQKSFDPDHMLMNRACGKPPAQVSYGGDGRSWELCVYQANLARLGAFRGAVIAAGLPEYQPALDQALAEGRDLLALTQKQPDEPAPAGESVDVVGAIGKLLQGVGAGTGGQNGAAMQVAGETMTGGQPVMPDMSATPAAAAADAPSPAAPSAKAASNQQLYNAALAKEESQVQQQQQAIQQAQTQRRAFATQCLHVDKNWLDTVGYQHAVISNGCQDDVWAYYTDSHGAGEGGVVKSGDRREFVFKNRGFGWMTQLKGCILKYDIGRQCAGKLDGLGAY